MLRLRVNTGIRFGVAAFLAGGPWIAAALHALTASTAIPLSILGGVVASYGTALWALGRHLRRVSGPNRAPLRGVMVAAVMIDLLALAVAVSLLGGVRSPFMTFYVIHVTLSCIVLSSGSAIAVTAVAFLLVVLQVALELSGMIAIPGAVHLELSTAVVTTGVYGTLFAAMAILVIPVVRWLRRSEAELRVRNLHLDRLSALRRDFLHVAVHNLRSPVGASLVHVQNLRAGLAGPVNERQSEWLDPVEHRLEGLLKLLQDMQTLGEIETDLLSERGEATDVNEVVGELVSDYQFEATTRNLQLTWEPAAGLPPVLAVPRLIREAVRNYVTNAFKFAPEGDTVTVRTRELTEGSERWVRVEVEDHGPGIPPDRLDKLFREFIRLPVIRGGERPPGSGLGLSITRRIAEVHGGSVGVESEPGKGSVFFLLLPPHRPRSGPDLRPGVEDAAPGAPEAPRSGRASAARR